MSANKVKPEIVIKINKSDYKIVFGLRALVELKKKTGKNPLNGELGRNLDPEDLAAFLWAGLIKHHDLGYEEVIDLVDSIDEIQSVCMAIEKAMENAQPAPEEVEEKKTS